MKALILAGGAGTRLWPLSRQNYPKQFLKIEGERSLLQQTAERLLTVLSPEDLIVLTNEDYKFHVISDFAALKTASRTGPQDAEGESGRCVAEIPCRVVLEPAKRNTAPAIALGVKYCLEKLGCSEDEVIFVSPADHIIRPTERFSQYLRLAEEVAKEGFLVTFGIVPTRPETGYGYIRTAEGGQGGKDERYFKVDRFAEKPERSTAEKYLKEGTYFWNSGMFAFTIRRICEEIDTHAPGIGRLLQRPYDEMIAAFTHMPDISIDYAVLEKSDRVVTLPLDIYWNDIGSWDSIYEISEKDERNNAGRGDIISIDTRDSLIIGQKRLIAAIGLEDCLVVETEDAVLIAKRGEAQRVKEIVERLQREKRRESTEHVTTYRPWGSYTVLEEGRRYKIKRIVVNPCEKLSLQKHYHRSEHWVVVTGTAKVTIDNQEMFIHENESAYVPKSTLHRLENPGKVPLEIIEVQNGEYVGEDDIVRVDDRYGREKKA